MSRNMLIYVVGLFQNNLNLWGKWLFNCTLLRGKSYVHILSAVEGLSRQGFLIMWKSNSAQSGETDFGLWQED